MPATVGELLALAEDEVQAFTDVLLQDPDLRLAPVLRAWRAFDSAARSALAVTLGPRVPTHPVDAAVASWVKGLRPPAGLTASSPGGRHLLRAARLLGAAGDLLSQIDAPAAVAHAAAARMASVAAAAAYTLVVTGGHQGYTPSQDLAPVVRAHIAASRVVDAHSGVTASPALNDVMAEPTSIPYSAGARLSAAALRLGRECLAAEPCSEVFILGAVSTGRLMITAWQVLDGGRKAGLVKGPLDEVRDSLRDAALAWRQVAHDWRRHVVPGGRPESVRTAAAEFASACDSLMPAGAAVTPAVLRDAVAGLSRSLAQSVRLHEAQHHLPGQLANAQLIFVPARSVPARLDRLQSVLRGQYVPAPREAATTVTSNWATALRLTRSAQMVVADVQPQIAHPSPSHAHRRVAVASGSLADRRHTIKTNPGTRHK